MLRFSHLSTAEDRIGRGVPHIEYLQRGQPAVNMATVTVLQESWLPGCSTI